MQGVPGSGKSTVARLIADNIVGVICSTDDYFYKDGEYKFDPEKLGEYHSRNLQHATDLMAEGCNVVIDNTNILQKHVRPYVNAARQNGYHVQFVRITGDNFGNIHKVPEEVVERMRHQMEGLE